MSLDGKVVIITGPATGIGAANENVLDTVVPEDTLER